MGLLDISIGGAKFTYPKCHIFHAGQTIKFKLIIHNAIFNIDAGVRNVRDPYPNATNKIQYVCVEFHHNDKKMEASLGKAIMDIERTLLAEGKI